MAENESKKVEKEEKKKVKSDKPSFWQKFKNFFKGLKSECKKIVWYGRKQTFKSTVLVIVCLVIVALIVGLIDLGLTSVIAWLGGLV